MSWSGSALRYAAVSGLSLAVGPGELALVRDDEQVNHLPLCDLAGGVLRPDRGAVRFEGQCWEEASGRRRSAMRGRIGRVFREQAWLSNLNLYENIALSPRYHGTLAEGEIRERASRLASAAGIDHVLTLRPNQAHRRELQLAQWVRAFLGQARLVLLHHPTRGLGAETHALLLEWVRGALDRGCAVVWISSSSSRWQDRELAAARRFLIRDGSLVPFREDD